MGQIFLEGAGSGPERKERKKKEPMKKIKTDEPDSQNARGSTARKEEGQILGVRLSQKRKRIKRKNRKKKNQSKKQRVVALWETNRKKGKGAKNKKTRRKKVQNQEETKKGPGPIKKTATIESGIDGGLLRKKGRGCSKKGGVKDARKLQARSIVGDCFQETRIWGSQKETCRRGRGGGLHVSKIGVVLVEEEGRKEKGEAEKKKKPGSA